MSYIARDQILSGLRRVRDNVGPEPRRAAEQVQDLTDLDAAIAYLETRLEIELEARFATGFREGYTRATKALVW